MPAWYYYNNTVHSLSGQFNLHSLTLSRSTYSVMAATQPKARIVINTHNPMLIRMQRTFSEYAFSPTFLWIFPQRFGNATFASVHRLTRRHRHRRACVRICQNIQHSHAGVHAEWKSEHIVFRGIVKDDEWRRPCRCRWPPHYAARVLRCVSVCVAMWTYLLWFARTHEPPATLVRTCRAKYAIMRRCM